MYNSNNTKGQWALAVIPALCCVMAVVLAASLEYTNALTTVTSGSTDGLALRTGLFALAGGAAALAASRTDTALLQRFCLPIGALGLILTALTFTPLGYSPEGSDDRAWLGAGMLSFQPSEVLKLCFIVTFSAHLCRAKNISRPGSLGLLMLHGAVPAALVWAQGDQGTAVVFIIIAAVMLVAGGLPFPYLAAALIALPAGGGLLSGLLKEHQRQRIAVLFDPGLDPLGAGFQQLQSRRAIAGGGLLGKGLFTDGRGFVYVSQSQNDFILAYAGQAAGLLMCGIMTALLFGLCLAVFSVKAETPFGRSLCTGVGALFFAHTLINTAMALGFMPVIGVPLPFFSAGGTAMITMLMALGFVSAAQRPEKQKGQQ